MYGPIHYIWESWELWLYVYTSTLQNWKDDTNVTRTVSIQFVAICILHSCCKDVEPILRGLYICVLGEMGAMLVRLYNYCTNLDWCHQCSMNRFKPFGGNSHPVQWMYGRSANFLHDYSIREIWCNTLCIEELGAKAVSLYIDCTNLNWRHQCSTHHFKSIWFPFESCTVFVCHLKRSIHMYCGIARS